MQTPCARRSARVALASANLWSASARFVAAHTADEPNPCCDRVGRAQILRVNCMPFALTHYEHIAPDYADDASPHVSLGTSGHVKGSAGGVGSLSEPLGGLNRFRRLRFLLRAQTGRCCPCSRTTVQAPVDLSLRPMPRFVQHACLVPRQLGTYYGPGPPFQYNRTKMKRHLDKVEHKPNASRIIIEP